MITYQGTLPMASGFSGMWLFRELMSKPSDIFLSDYKLTIENYIDAKSACVFLALCHAYFHSVVPLAAQARSCHLEPS